MLRFSRNVRAFTSSCGSFTGKACATRDATRRGHALLACATRGESDCSRRDLDATKDRVSTRGSSAATHEMHDFQDILIKEGNRCVLCPWNYVAISLDGDGALR